jgi:hypothetical protein
MRNTVASTVRGVHDNTSGSPTVQGALVVTAGNTDGADANAASEARSGSGSHKKSGSRSIGLHR